MKLAFEPIIFLRILLGTTFLVLVSLPLSTYSSVFGSATSSIYIFTFLNTVIWAILVKSGGLAAESYNDDFLSFLHSVCEEEAEQTEEKSDNNADESSTDSDDYQYDSSDTLGYEEDDEWDGHSELDWEDIDEEHDDTLNTRIEEFIAKVIKGWREEQMEENLIIKQVD